MRLLQVIKDEVKRKSKSESKPIRGALRKRLGKAQRAATSENRGTYVKAS